MLLMIVIGLFTTFLGVALGSAVLELTVRMLGNSLAERPSKRLLRSAADTRRQAEA